MRLFFSLSLVFLFVFAVPAQAESMRCTCTHLPIQPKACANLCFGALLNTISRAQMESVLGLDAQLSNDIAAIRNAEPIGSIADLRAKLPEGSFERLEPKIQAAASGDIQEVAVLTEQLAALTPPTGAVTDDAATFTGDQMAAFDAEEQGERPIGSYSDGDVGALPETGSGMPLLGLVGGISLMVSLSLRVLRRRTKAM